jgi:hypothetical protein
MWGRKEGKESLKNIVVKNKDTSKNIESKGALERENKNKRTNMMAKEILIVLSWKYQP